MWCGGGGGGGWGGGRVNFDTAVDVTPTVCEMKRFLFSMARGAGSSGIALVSVSLHRAQHLVWFDVGLILTAPEFSSVPTFVSL